MSWVRFLIGFAKASELSKRTRSRSPTLLLLAVRILRLLMFLALVLLLAHLVPPTLLEELPLAELLQAVLLPDLAASGQE